MIKLIKILTIVTLLIFTGCDEPLGKKTTTTILTTKDMDPRLKAYPEAVEWYKDAGNYPEAAFNLGVIYQTKIKDYKESLIWYSKAYNLGYKNDIENNIASVYEDMKDYKSSIDWYIKSNSLDSIANLGLLYKSKLKDYKNSIKYYKLAIERESLRSLRGMAWLYHENLKDDVKSSAYMINLIEYGKTKHHIVSFLKEKWNLSDETIKKGYELQLTMPGLPRRYTGGI